MQVVFYFLADDRHFFMTQLSNEITFKDRTNFIGDDGKT